MKRKSSNNFAIAMEVIEKIRMLRLSKGYSQEYIASRIGIETVNYGRIERGQAKLTVERLLKICEILEVSPSDLFDEKQNQVLNYLKKIYETEKEILSTLKKTEK